MLSKEELKAKSNGFFFGPRGLVNSPFEVEPEDVTLAQIARNLSRICRYVGNGDHFYSVAEHSVELSYRVSPQYAKDALFHDATEVFLGDLHSLIKRLMHETGDHLYSQMENHLYKNVIAVKFGLSPTLPDEVHRVDKAFQTKEIESLFKGGPFKLEAWTPEHAEREFLYRAHELGLEVAL